MGTTRDPQASEMVVARVTGRNQTAGGADGNIGRIKKLDKMHSSGQGICSVMK